MMHIHNQKLFVILSQENNFNSFHRRGTKNVSTRIHPKIAWKDKPSTHQIFWWMLVLYEWRSMDKTQNMNDVQHKTGQEMHREVRATLTSDQLN
jgi:hypothetical protein